MKHTPLLPFAAVCFATTLAPSCVHWNTGTALRESATINTGVDVLHPVEGKLYRVGKGERATYYMQAPEVTYTPRHRYGYCRDILDQKYLVDPGKDIIAADVRPTGRLCWVRVRPSSFFECHLMQDDGWCFEQEVEALPAGAKLVRTGETFDYTPMASQFGTLSTRESGWKGVKRVLSYPAGYVVDPLLWVVSNAGVAAVTVAMAPVTIIGMPVCFAQVSAADKRSVETWPQRKALREKTVSLTVDKRGTSFVYSADDGRGGLWLRSDSARDLSVIELAEVMDTRKPYFLIIRSDLTKSECERVITELRAYGFNLTAMEKDGELTSLSVPKP